APRDWQELLRKYGQVRSCTGVKRELLLALRDDATAFAKDWILELAKQYDGQDRFYLEAIGIAVGHHDQKRREIILADFDKHFPEINDKVLDLIWELRPPVMMPKLGKLLADPKLPANQRSRIVDTLASADDAAAGKALLGVLQSDAPAELKQHVIDNL